MTQTALIIGVSGFIGRHLAKQFASNGFRVVGVGNSAPENAPLSFLDGYYSLTLPSKHSELSLIIRNSRPSVCVHCAGRSSVPYSVQDPSSDFHNSVDITFDILENIRMNSPMTKVIFLSSAAVYGNPTHYPVSERHPLLPISPYGFHKKICEELCIEFNRIYGLPSVIVRIFSAYGPGLRRQVIWDLCSKIFAGSPVLMQGTGNESRDFIHVNDVTRALVLLASKATFEAEAYNLASGKETKISELAEMIKDMINPNTHLEYGGTVPSGTPVNWKSDMTKLLNLGFKPEVELENGVRQFVTWCKTEIHGI